MTNYTEDDLVGALIDNYSDYHYDDEARREFYPEAPYNYYGDRGVVDLHIHEISLTDPNYYYDFLFEVKADSAVKNSTGANEILRQFNRMRRYFHKDESNKPASAYTMELTFIPSEVTFKHVIDNISMYIQATESSHGPDTSGFQTEIVTFRFPDSENITPVHVTDDFHPLKKTENFMNHLETNPQIKRIAESVGLENYIESMK